MQALYLIALSFFSSVFGTVTGFGMPVVMNPLLQMFLPSPIALAIVSILYLVTNIWKIILFRSGFQWRLFFYFGLPGLVATVIGIRVVVVSGHSLPLLLRLFGLLLIGYSVMILVKPRFYFSPTPIAAMLGGLLSGFFTFGVSVIARSAALCAYDLPKKVYLATGAAVGFIFGGIWSVANSLFYFEQLHRLDQTMWYSFIISIPITFLGAYVGSLLVDRIPQSKFRIIIVFFLLLKGIQLLLYPYTLS